TSHPPPTSPLFPYTTLFRSRMPRGQQQTHPQCHASHDHSSSISNLKFTWYSCRIWVPSTSRLSCRTSSMKGVVINPEYTSARVPELKRPASSRPCVDQETFIAPGCCAGSAR